MIHTGNSFSQSVLIYSCLSTWNSEKELCTWTRRVRFEFFHYLSDLWPFIFLIYKMEMIIPTYMHGVVVKNKLINVPKHFINVMYYHTHYPYPWNKVFRNERLIRVGVGFWFLLFWLKYLEVSEITYRWTSPIMSFG